MALDVATAGGKEVHVEAQRLVEAWCDRRCFVALRHALGGWPITNPLTDGWADFMIAMKNVRAFARAELLEDELDAVDDLVRVAERVVHRR